MTTPHDHIRYARTATSISPTRCSGRGGGVDLVCIEDLRLPAPLSDGCRPMTDFTAGLERIGRVIMLRSSRHRLVRPPRGCGSFFASHDRGGCRLSPLWPSAQPGGSGAGIVGPGGPWPADGCMFAPFQPDDRRHSFTCATRPRVGGTHGRPTTSPLRQKATSTRCWRGIDRDWCIRSMAEADRRRHRFEGMTHEEQVDWYLENMRVSAGPGDAAAAYRMFYESDVRHVLGTIRVPTLV